MFGLLSRCRKLLPSVQVETIRDAYMVVAGVPNKTTFHAHHICDMALDMLSSIDHLKDPSTGDNIQIRVGEWSQSSLATITHPDYLAGHVSGSETHHRFSVLIQVQFFIHPKQSQKYNVEILGTTEMFLKI